MKKYSMTRRRFSAQLTSALPISFLAAKAEPNTEQYKQAEARLFHQDHVNAKSDYFQLQKPTLKLRVLQAGSGEPLVLIHGGGAMAAQFAPLIGSLEAGFQIYAPDRPGCGLSDKLDYTGVPIRQQAVDCMKGLFDALHLPKAAIAGCSIGGYWGLVFALAAPERVSKLILLGGPAGSAPKSPGRPPLRSEQPPPTFESIRAEYHMLMANGDRASNEMIEASLAAAGIPGAALAWDSMVKEAGRQFPTPLTYALRPELKNLKPPTLFLMGDKDMEGPPTLAQEMAALAPHGRYQFVPDSGHVIWLDQPELVTKSVWNFLKVS
jgi:pimeloyl-ACP methyl ester carboxylesterase